MSEAAGGAPAVSTGASETVAALPEGMLTAPKVSTSSKKKFDAYDLENEAEDKPIVHKEAYKDESDGLADQTGSKKAAKKTEKKVEKKPQAEAVDDEDEDDESEEDNSDDEDEVDTKPRKKRALEITNDEDEDEELPEEENESDENAASDAEDTSKVDPKLLEKKYKVTVKDGDKNIEKEYSLKQLFDMAAKNESGDLKLYQAAEFYKKTENVVERLKTEPFEILKYIADQTGQNYYNMIEAEMANQFKLKMMPPEQRDKKELANFRKEQAEIKQRLEREELTKQQAKIANDFVTSVGDIIQTDPYLKHVYDNLDEGEDKNYIIRKFGSFIQNGLIMKKIPEGQPNHLPANFDLSPKNPIIIKLVSDEIRKEAEIQVKNAARAQKFMPQTERAEEIVNKAGTTIRKKVPGVKDKPGNVKKPTSKEKREKRQSTYDFLRELTG